MAAPALSTGVDHALPSAAASLIDLARLAVFLLATLLLYGFLHASEFAIRQFGLHAGSFGAPDPSFLFDEYDLSCVSHSMDDYSTVNLHASSSWDLLPAANLPC